MIMTRTIRDMVGVEPGDKLPAHSWPGGYDIVYVTDDGGCLCADCANRDGSEDPDDKGGGWYLAGVMSAADSDSCHYCDHCNRHLAGYCDGENHSEYCDNRLGA